MSMEDLLHYISLRLDLDGVIDRIMKPGGYICRVKVDHLTLVFDEGDIKTLKSVEESADWTYPSTLHERLAECLKTGKKSKREVRDE